MAKISRRDFLKQTAKTAVAVAAGSGLAVGSKQIFADAEKLGRIRLGRSGVEVSRLACGTGTHGWKFRSNQTALGEKRFTNLAQHAFNSGITFFDVADIYGSHRYLREALKYIPREKVVILTKIWTRSNDWIKYEGINPTLDRFRKEVGTDYFDIVLLHCQVTPEWPEELKEAREALSKAKEKGIVRAVGVSCHSLDALKAAAASDWVQVIFARINHTGSHMDAPPNEVMPVLKQAHQNGKGIVGMKVFGVGDLVAEEQRQASLQFVWGSGNVDAVTIGFESADQIDDAIRRTNRILKG